MTYSVVELEDGVVIIATKWIIPHKEKNSCYCFYPPNSAAQKINEIVKKLIDPEEDWGTYKIIKILKTTSTLEKAREKLLESLVLSEVDSEATDNYSEKFKKSRQERTFKRSSSPDCVQKSEKFDRKKNTKLKPKIIENVMLEPDNQFILPPVFKRPLLEATIEHSSSTSKNVKENYDSSSGASEAPKGSHSEEKQPKPKELKSIVQNNSVTKATIEYSSSASTNLKENDCSLFGSSKVPKGSRPEEKQPKSKELKSNIRKSMVSMSYQDKNSGATFEELTLSKLNEIILSLRNINLQSPHVIDTANRAVSFFDSDDCPNLPVKTKEEFENLNHKLNKKSFRKRMIQALGSIGGRNLRNIVANICKKIFANEIAVLYSWSGRKKPKVSLQDTNFAALIISSVRAYDSQFSEEDTKQACSTWFTQAQTRLNRKIKEQDNDKGIADDDEGTSDDQTDADDEQD